MRGGGKNVCIYNAGCEGYNVVQDTIKLMRDIVELKPDIVLEVSGVNETWWDEEYPYGFTYLEDVYHKATEEAVCKGICHTQPFWKQWMDNIEIMNAICKIHNIKYFAFLQPMLGGKRNRDIDEESRLLSWFNIIKHKRIEKQRSFGNMIDQIKKDDNENKYSYIHNLMHIFDEIHNVYIDECHLNEQGNQILAETIWSYIS